MECDTNNLSPNPPKMLTSRPLRERNVSTVSSYVPNPSKKRKVGDTENTCSSSSEILGASENTGSSVSISVDVPKASPHKKKTCSVFTKMNKMRQMIKKLRCQVWRYKQKLKKMKKSKTPANEENYALSPACAEFIKSQVSMVKRHPKGRRWSYANKMLALSLYYRSPKVYRFCAKVFALPSKSTLKVWASSFNVHSGFSEDIFNVLKKKASALGEKERLCVLCIDEIALKYNLQFNIKLDVIKGFEDFGTSRTGMIANNSLVFMIRGITSNYKQPVAYFICHNACNVHIIEQNLYVCLDKLKSAGFLVKSIVTDQGSNFLQLTRKLGVLPEKPYFEYDGKKYFYIFDAPHLLKSTRNNLFNHDVEFEGNKIAKWSHIASLYEHDAGRQFRLAPKLSSRHVELPAFSKMKVKLAAQTLSRSVAMAIGTEVTFGLQSPDATQTAEFVEKIDLLFDICNSSAIRCNKKRKEALSKGSLNMKNLKDLSLWISKLKVRSRESGNVVSVNFITGWQVTVNAILNMYENLQNECGIKFLFTRRLNQDALENFFGAVRLGCGNNDNPTVFQFEEAFKHSLLTQMLMPGNRGNCDPDDDSFLCDVVSLCAAKEPQKESPPTMEQSGSTTVNVKASMPMELPEENSFVYICGYLLRKVFEHHSCQKCKELLVTNSLENDSQLLTHFKAYNTNAGDFCSLYVPVEEFIVYMKQCESEFVMCMRSTAHLPFLRKRIVECMKQISVPCCTCKQFPWEMLLKIYVNMRVFYVIKFPNRELTQMGRKQRKLLKVLHL